MLGLIDTDPGIDDALALLFAWGSPDLRLAGITTVAGNVGVADATVNLFRLLALRRPTPAPAIAQGAAQPLRRPLVTAQGYHGADGMGELADWPPVQPMQSALSPLSQLDAADFILDAVRTASEPLTLIALGPLTNVALALGRAPRVLAGLERLVVMGGAVDVPGNVTPTAEFNIHVDPEAAAAVLAAGLRVDLVPLDATHQAVLPRRPRMAPAATGGRWRSARGLTDYRWPWTPSVAVRAFPARPTGRCGRPRSIARGVGGRPARGRLRRFHATRGRRAELPLRATGRRPALSRRVPGAPVPRVLVLGSANVDFTVALSRLPRPGETVSEGTLLVARGGKGANQAVAARRLGAEVRLVGCIGADQSGLQVREALAGEGIGVDA
jgi:inosine-uridine nucleoside N-ribohydrolase